MRTPEATLIEPTEELRAEFHAMAEEYYLAGDFRYQPALEDFPAFVRGLLDGARGGGLPPGRVPYSTFWLTSGRHPIGGSRIRHHLTPDLEDEGGHGGVLQNQAVSKRSGKLISRYWIEL